MKITGDFENALIKMIKEETLKANDYDDSEIIMYEPIEIYEVEDWGLDSFDPNKDGWSEYFTTLEEAEQYFDEITTDYDECYAEDYDEYRNYTDEYGTKRIEATKYVTDREEYNYERKGPKITYTKTGCTLRKLKVDLWSENPVSLDIDYEQPIKEVVEKIIYRQ